MTGSSSSRSQQEAPAPETRVRAALVGALPGQELLEALSILRGELGAPHRSGLAPMPHRCAAADQLPRTVAVLTELWCDLQPHGWRLQSHDSRESRAAQSLLASDINVLADVIGAEAQGDREPVATELLGPATLAAQLHLHSGERVLRDHGARREIAESLADGIGDHVRALQAAAAGRPVAVRWAEPELDRVLTGTIPTASGYRTLRAVPRAEIRAGLERVSAAARAAGADSVELVLPPETDPQTAASFGADRLVVAAPGPQTRDWEPIAALLDAGIELSLSLPELLADTGRPFSAVRAVEAIAGPWQDVGIPLAQLSRLMIAVGPGLEDTDPRRVRTAAARAAETAHGLQQTALEG